MITITASPMITRSFLNRLLGLLCAGGLRSRAGYREDLAGVVDVQDESTEEAVDAEQDDMKIWHEVYGGVRYCMKVLACSGMKNVELRHMGVCRSHAVPGAYLFCLPHLKVVAENRGEGGRNGAFIRASVDNAMSPVALACMRIDNSDGENGAVDAVPERTEGAVFYRH